MPARNGDTLAALEYRAHRARYPVGYADITWGVSDQYGNDIFPTHPSGKLAEKPATVDSGRFHHDAMSDAMTAHQTPSMGLNSRNVKRSYNGRKAAKAALGVTGGHVEGASAQTTGNAKRNARSAGKHGTMTSRRSGRKITFL